MDPRRLKGVKTLGIHLLKAVTVTFTSDVLGQGLSEGQGTEVHIQIRQNGAPSHSSPVSSDEQRTLKDWIGGRTWLSCTSNMDPTPCAGWPAYTLLSFGYSRGSQTSDPTGQGSLEDDCQVQAPLAHSL